MIAFKLLKLRKDGTLGSLFINTRQILPIGKWLLAEDHKTKGYAHRPGFHVVEKPVAPHLSKKGRVWAVVTIKNYKELIRPQIQGCKWYIAKQMKINKLRCNYDG